MADSSPKGLIVALVTPLAPQGTIDWPALQRLVERVIPHCDGLWVGEAHAGEGLSLSNPARLELLRGALGLVAGRRPLLLSPTADTTEETLSNVRSLEEHRSGRPGGETILLVDLPLWYHSNRNLGDLYREWGKCTPLPLLLYNNPYLIRRLNRSLKRTNIRTAVLKDLAGNEQIAGLIQVGDLRRTIHYQRAVRSRRDFRFYDGDERSFLNQPSASGVVSWGANLLPAEWKGIVVASLNLSEDPAQNLVLWKESQRLRELAQALRVEPAMALKFALRRLGVISKSETLEKGETSFAGKEEIGNFLQENFSLSN